ncbi:hypothetical protein N7457_006502 [Penicillium paradoxum]|uniref:uncharacterized protein n=1 Tax=Penicillium paradoxum TaxID=176176 RepID=UPI0025479230|nr:uncharacterized protein N7457_006502 [Penicillium paradoxum]KAJ5781342.1 hypothetical protein N7457_006502 [Penicillium paradoxum]
MDSNPPFIEYPAVSMEEIAQSSTFDPSLPADHPFVTRAMRFQAPLSHLESTNPHEAYPQEPWWKSDLSPSSMGLVSTDMQQGNHLAPWFSTLSTVSDPQSPRSSNSGSMPTINYYSSPFLQDDIVIPTLDIDYNTYPMPDNLIDAEPSPCWPSSHSDRNPTPETRWSSPSHQESITLTPRPKARASSTSRVRRTIEARAGSASGRRRRRPLSSAANEGIGPPRTFVCSFAPYGCKSTFVSKNEWKRHVTSQHLLLGFYRCDVGRCKVRTPVSTSKSRCDSPPPGQPNDFNRKDLFTQHHRRMHAPWQQPARRRVPADSERQSFESSLEAVRRRCWHPLRDPPIQSHCGFCGETFKGSTSWDVRMEHVGRHFEREDTACLGNEIEDVALREWGLAEGILTIVDGQCRLTSLLGAET